MADPVILDQTEARRAKKNFLDRSPPFLRVWMTAPSPPPPLRASEKIKKITGLSSVL